VTKKIENITLRDLLFFPEDEMNLSDLKKQQISFQNALSGK